MVYRPGFDEVAQFLRAVWQDGQAFRAQIRLLVARRQEGDHSGGLCDRLGKFCRMGGCENDGWSCISHCSPLRRRKTHSGMRIDKAPETSPGVTDELERLVIGYRNRSITRT